MASNALTRASKALKAARLGTSLSEPSIWASLLPVSGGDGKIGTVAAKPGFGFDDVDIPRIRLRPWLRIDAMGCLAAQVLGDVRLRLLRSHHERLG